MIEPTKDVKAKFEKVIESLEASLKAIHTGRAHAGLLEDIKVNHYNSLLPLKQLASITSSSPNELVVRPWDPGVLQPIETALREAGRNLNPTNDGQVVRVILPPLSAETRQEVLKLVQRQAEAAKVGLRSIREESWRQVIQAQRKSEITQDDRYRIELALNKLIREYNEAIDNLAESKRQSLEV